MKKEIFYLSLVGDYSYQKGSPKVTFLINKKIFETSTRNVVYMTQTEDKEVFEFLLKFSSAELKKLQKTTDIVFDIRPGFGTEFVKPKNPYPPSTIEIKSVVGLKY